MFSDLDWGVNNLFAIRTNKAIEHRLKLLDLHLLMEHKLLQNAVVLDDLVNIQSRFRDRPCIPQQDPIDGGIRNIRMHSVGLLVSKHCVDNSACNICIKHTLHVNKCGHKVCIGELIEIDTPDNTDIVQTELETNLLLSGGIVNTGNVETVVGGHFVNLFVKLVIYLFQLNSISIFFARKRRLSCA